MADYTVVNLKRDVEDQAPKFGYAPTEARFARQRLELKKSGLSHFQVAPARVSVPVRALPFRAGGDLPGHRRGGAREARR